MSDWNSKTFRNLFQELFGSTSFTEIERKIAEYVYSTVQTEIEVHKPVIDDCDNNERSIIQSNLECIINCLNECISAREKLLRKFPVWKTVRVTNIESLKKIAGTINTNRSNCNISKLVGSSVSVVGGTMCIVAAALAPFTFGLTVPIAITGGVASGLGGVTTFGTSVTEISLLRNRINEAKNILKEDREAFECIQEWMSSGRALVEAIDVVLKFDIAKKLSNDMVKFIKSVTDTSSLLREKLRLVGFIKGMVSEHLPPELFATSMSWEIIPFLICIIFISILMHRECSFIFDSVVFTLRIICGLCASVDVGVDVAALAVSSLRNGAEVSASVGRAVAKGTIAAFAVVLDVANIVLTSIDVHNGSLSEQATEIMNVADAMQKELDVLQQVYNELHDQG